MLMQARWRIHFLLNLIPIRIEAVESCMVQFFLAKLHEEELNFAMKLINKVENYYQKC